LPEDKRKGKYAETIHHFEKPGNYIAVLKDHRISGTKAVGHPAYPVISKIIKK
jgi:hypothetical protein